MRNLKTLLASMLILAMLVSCSGSEDLLSYAQLSARYERLKSSNAGLTRTPGENTYGGGIATYSGYMSMTTKLSAGVSENFLAKMVVTIDFAPASPDRVVVTNIAGVTSGNVNGALQSMGGVTFSLDTPGQTTLKFSAHNLQGRMDAGEFSGQLFGEFYGDTPDVIDGYLPSTLYTIGGDSSVVVGRFIVVRE